MKTACLDAPSRLKGIETELCVRGSRHPHKSLDVPSRLKGIETLPRLADWSTCHCRLDVPSRLKGIETKEIFSDLKNPVGLLGSTFPFEGN